MKNVKVWLALCAACLVAGIIGSIFVLSHKEGVVAEIVQDGIVIYQIDISQAAEQTIDIEYNGRMNSVQIDKSGIRVLYADCPDQTCVHMGYLGENGLPIVCLPNHLVIQYKDAGQDIDVVAQ